MFVIFPTQVIIYICFANSYVIWGIEMDTIVIWLLVERPVIIIWLPIEEPGNKSDFVSQETPIREYVWLHKERNIHYEMIVGLSKGRWTTHLHLALCFIFWAHDCLHGGMERIT